MRSAFGRRTRLCSFDQNMFVFEGIGGYRGGQGSSRLETVKLSDCLREFFKTESLDEQNQYKCPKCSQESQAWIKTRVKLLPRVLIIHMKRFANNATKLKNPLQFEETLSIDREYLAINADAESDNQVGSPAKKATRNNIKLV